MLKPNVKFLMLKPNVKWNATSENKSSFIILERKFIICP